MNKRICAAMFVLLLTLPIVVSVMPIARADPATLGAVPVMLVDDVTSRIFVTGEGYDPNVELWWQINEELGWDDTTVDSGSLGIASTADGEIPDGAYLETYLDEGAYYLYVADDDVDPANVSPPMEITVVEVGPYITYVETQDVEVGDEVVIEGEGFTPSLPVELYWDGSLFKTASADEDGYLDTTITIPETAEEDVYGDPHTFMALDWEGMPADYDSAWVLFWVSPSVETDVLSIDGQRGTSFTIFGHGFPAGKRILLSTEATPRDNVELDDSGTAFTYHDEVRVADDGTFELKVTLAESFDVPDETGYNEIEFEYSDLTSDYVDNAIIVSTPDWLGDERLWKIYNIDEDGYDWGYVGDSIEVTVWNFPAEEEITFIFGPETLGTITTDENGAGQEIFTVPELPGNGYLCIAAYEAQGLRAVRSILFEVYPLMELYDAEDNLVYRTGMDEDEWEYVDSGDVLRIVAAGFEPQKVYELDYTCYDWATGLDFCYDIIADGLYVDIIKGTIVRNGPFDYRIETTALGSLELTFEVTYVLPPPYPPAEPDTGDAMAVIAWDPDGFIGNFLAVTTPDFIETDYYTAKPQGEYIFPWEVYIENLVPHRRYQLLFDTTPLMLTYGVPPIDRDYFMADGGGCSPWEDDHGIMFSIPSTPGVYSLSVVYEDTTTPLESIPFIVSMPPESPLPEWGEIMLLEDKVVYDQEVIVLGWNFAAEESLDFYLTGYGYLGYDWAHDETGAVYYTFDWSGIDYEGGVYAVYLEREIAMETYQVGPALLTIEPRLLLHDSILIHKGWEPELRVELGDWWVEELELAVDTAFVEWINGEYEGYYEFLGIWVEAHGLAPNTYYYVVWDVEGTKQVLEDSAFRTDEDGWGRSEPVAVPAALTGEYCVGVTPKANPTAIVESYRLDRFGESCYEGFPVVSVDTLLELAPEAMAGELVSYEFDERWLFEYFDAFMPVEEKAWGTAMGIWDLMPIYVTVYLDEEPIVYATVDFAVRSMTDGGTFSGTTSGTVTGDVSGDLSGSITGDVSGDLSGSITGDVSGTLNGTMNGELWGDGEGRYTGNVKGEFEGTSSGMYDGYIGRSGTLWGGWVNGDFDGEVECRFWGSLDGKTLNGGISDTEFNGHFGIPGTGAAAKTAVVLGVFDGYFNGDFDVGTFSWPEYPAYFVGWVTGTFEGVYYDQAWDGPFEGRFRGTLDGQYTGGIGGDIETDFDGYILGLAIGIGVGGIETGYFAGHLTQGEFEAELFVGNLEGQFEGNFDGNFDIYHKAWFEGWFNGSFEGYIHGGFQGEFDGTFDGSIENGEFTGTISGTWEYELVPVIAIHGTSTGATFKWQHGIISGSFIMPDGEPNALLKFTIEITFNEPDALPEDVEYWGFRTSAGVIRAPSLLVQILARLDEVEAHIVEVITTAEGNIIVKIDSALGEVTASLDEIEGKLDRIEDGMAVIDTTLGEIKVKLDDIKAQIVEVITTAEGNIIATIDTTLGTIEAKLEDIEPNLVNIEEGVATIITTLGILEMPDLETIGAALTDIEGRLATIESDIGTITTDVSNIGAEITSIEGRLVTIETDMGTIQADIVEINAQLVSIDADIVTIKTDIGTAKTSLTDINTKISVINNNMAVIETDLGTIKGTVTSIQGKVVTIETDIGTIKTTTESVQDTNETISSLQPISVGLSVIAAIAAIAAVIMILRKVYVK